MSWQKCPVCNGSGGGILTGRCKIYKGKGIILEITGLPPGGEIEDISVKANESKEDINKIDNFDIYG